MTSFDEPSADHPAAGRSAPGGWIDEIFPGRRMISRRRVWEIVDRGRPGDVASRRFHLSIMVMIAISVLAAILESVQELNARYHAEFVVLEAFSVAVFAAEYGARMWSCVEDARYREPVLGRLRMAVAPRALVDLLAILPFFVGLAAVDLRVLRGARLFRLVRLLKAGRYLNALLLLRRVLRAKREELILAVALMMALLVVASTVMYHAENARQPKEFSSIPASMWWAVATLTTVGYGDIYPKTGLGRLVAGIIAILGVGLFALPTAIFGAGLVEAVQVPGACPHCGGALHGGAESAVRDG